MAVRTTGAAGGSAGSAGYTPIQRPAVSVANDGTLAAIIEAQSIAVVEIPGGAAFSEIGVDPEATASDVMWVGAPPRLLVLSRYATHSSVHLIDPYGPRTIAEIRLETPMKLYATVGQHALAIGANGTAILAATDSHITPYQFPARSIPAVAGAASNVFVVGLSGSIEEWDPASRMPKRRLRLPKPVGITAVGGSDRVVWMTTAQEPARIDVIPHVNRGQPKFHDLPEPIAHISSHPRSDLVVCLGADSGRLYVVDLDGRAPLRVIGPEGIDRTEAAALVMGRLVGVLAAQAGHPIAIVTLDRDRDELEPHPASPASPRPSTPPPLRPPADTSKRSTLYDDEDVSAPKAGDVAARSPSRPVPPVRSTDPSPRGSGSTLGEQLAAGRPPGSEGASRGSGASLAEQLAASRVHAEASSPPGPTRGPSPTRPPLTRPLGSSSGAYGVDTQGGRGGTREIPSVPRDGSARDSSVRDSSVHGSTALGSLSGDSSPRDLSVRDSSMQGSSAAPDGPSLHDSSSTAPGSSSRDTSIVSAGPRDPATTSGARERDDRPLSLTDRLAGSRMRGARPDLKTTWRDEVVSWARGVIGSAVDRPPPTAPPIDAIIQRLQITHLHTAVIFLYGAHLAGHDGVAPYDLSRVLGHRWDEALGRGDLAASGVATFASSRVRLSRTVQRALDELSPESGILVGEPGQIALMGPCVVVAPDGPMEPIARALLGAVNGAILAAPNDANIIGLFDDAQVYGAVPMVRTVHDLPGEPSIRVVADDEFAAELGIPRLDYTPSAT